MHHIDAGAGNPNKARFKCKHCNYESEWLDGISDTELRKGIPCESCNDET